MIFDLCELEEDTSWLARLGKLSSSNSVIRHMEWHAASLLTRDLEMLESRRPGVSMDLSYLRCGSAGALMMGGDVLNTVSREYTWD